VKALRIHPATFLFFLLLFFTGYSAVILPYIISVILHELGHAFVAKKLGYKLDRVWILPFGACISFEEFSFNPDDEIKIAFAGPIVNVLLILTTMTLWWIFPITYAYTYTFAIANFSLAMFNLLPAYPLDGGRILTGALRSQFKSKKVFQIACILNMAFSSIFFTLFLISFLFEANYSLAMISIFLFISTFEGKFLGKYSPILYQKFSKKMNKPLVVKSICIKSSTPFYKILPEINSHKYNIIYVIFPNEHIKTINEIQLQRLLEKYPLDKTFNDLLC
jgi:stage IV sporulation protein FB